MMTYDNRGSAAILGIGTALPEHRVEQEEAAERLAEALAGQANTVRWMRRLFRQCAVDTRYTCEPSFLKPVKECRYLPGTPAEDIPTTAERGTTYREHALSLGLAAAVTALEDAEVSPSEITHLLAVSCTGLYIPGLDAELVRGLGLAGDVQRLPLYFLGCAAGLKAIGIAQQLAEHDSSAKALIVCVELCSLHVQPSSERHELVAAAMFGDGASACVVGSATNTGRRFGGVFVLGRSRSVLLPEGGGDMTWRIGNTGFELVLSPRIPELLGKYVPAELELLMESGDAGAGGARCGKSGFERTLRFNPGQGVWAIHPGGRAILDAMQRLYGLTEEQLQSSRSVLRQYGNMSSATILFVLAELRRELDARAVCNEAGQGGVDGTVGCIGEGARRAINSRIGYAGVALAFGPGLTAELQRFDYLPSFDLELPDRLGREEMP